VIDDSRIGECDACHARFKVPASFRADRARCRECGGVVILERTQPVPRPPLEKSRKSKPVQRPDASADVTTDGRPLPRSPRTDARDSHHSGEQVPAHNTAVAPSSVPRPAPSKASDERTAAKTATEKQHAAPAKGSKKSGGVLGSIVAAAKAAMWRKKRDDAGSKG
jgi:hypothetical protein